MKIMLKKCSMALFSLFLISCNESIPEAENGADCISIANKGNMILISQNIDKIDSSIYYLKKALDCSPENDMFYANLSQAYSWKGDFENSLKYLREFEKRANVKGSDQIIIQKDKAVLFYHLGNKDSASILFERVYDSSIKNWKNGNSVNYQLVHAFSSLTALYGLSKTKGLRDSLISLTSNRKIREGILDIYENNCRTNRGLSPIFGQKNDTICLSK